MLRERVAVLKLAHEEREGPAPEVPGSPGDFGLILRLVARSSMQLAVQLSLSLTVISLLVKSFSWIQ